MPLIEFLIGGVQKGGTSALAHYLAAHPGVRLPIGKEAHVFDRPDLDSGWTTDRIDAEYASHFAQSDAAALFGDATPFYVFHPQVVARIARYNPAIKWIILLRDPADRAISHYYMERDRGLETLPLWAALLLETRRLRGHANDLSEGSPLRHHSYRARGTYARQLDTLLVHFPAEQILMLRSKDLLTTPDACMQRVYSFLGLAEPPGPASFERIFSRQQQVRHAWIHRALRIWFGPGLAVLRDRHGIVFDN